MSCGLPGSRFSTLALPWSEPPFPIKQVTIAPAIGRVFDPAAAQPLGWPSQQTLAAAAAGNSDGSFR